MKLSENAHLPFDKSFDRLTVLSRVEGLMALSKVEGLRYPHPSSLRRTFTCASFLGISEALHMNIFHQLLRSRFFGSLFITLIGTKLRENPMFFFIAGVQPKTVTLEGQPRRCPSCGLEQAVTKRVDHHLSIFFLPLVRVKKGSPFLQCQSCGSLSHESGEVWHGSQEGLQGHNCPYCGKRLEPGFRFCPFCGKPL